MRIIAVNTGIKFGEWYVDNLKHMIDNYSGLKYDSFEVIRDEKYHSWLINFKCLIDSKMVKIYILI